MNESWTTTAWLELRQQTTFQFSDVEKFNSDRGTIYKFLANLQKHGLIRKLPGTKRSENHTYIVEKTEVHGAVKGIDSLERKTWEGWRKDIWNQMRGSRRFTVRDIADGFKLPYKDVWKIFNFLYDKKAIRKIVKREEPSLTIWTVVKTKREVEYENLLDHKSRTPPKVFRPTDRQKQWNSMRIIKVFTAEDIAATAECELSYTKEYIRMLCRAGYLILVHKAPVGMHKVAGEYNVYRLLKDTGPKSPVIRNKDRNVFDPNTGLYHPFGQAKKLTKRKYVAAKVGEVYDVVRKV